MNQPFNLLVDLINCQQNCFQFGFNKLPYQQMKNEQSSERSSVIKKTNPRLGKVQSLDIIYLETPNSKFPHMFDYDEEYPKAKKMVLKDSAVLAVTKDGKFCFLKDSFDKDQKSKAILEKIGRIYCSFKSNQNYYLLKPINHYLAKEVWLDISSLPSKLFPLRKNDVIQMGSKRIRFRQLMAHDQVLPKEFTQELTASTKQVYENVATANDTSQQQKLCGICKKKGELNNPLVVPCKCQDSSKYMHFSCFKQLLMKRLKVKANQNSYTVTWALQQCQKCHSRYQTTFHIDNKPYNTVVIPRPDPPYVIFQHQAFNKQNIKKKYLEIIPVQQGNMLSIGRSTESSICLMMDESLQNGHCQLMYNAELKKFLLTDLGTQYGTLVKVRDSVKIRPHHPNVRVQIENVAVDLTVRRAESVEKCENYDASNKLFEDQTKQPKQEDSQFFA